jgi:hypothetical protein
MNDRLTRLEGIVERIGERLSRVDDFVEKAEDIVANLGAVEGVVVEPQTGPSRSNPVARRAPGVLEIMCRRWTSIGLVAAAAAVGALLLRRRA